MGTYRLSQPHKSAQCLSPSKRQQGINARGSVPAHGAKHPHQSPDAGCMGTYFLLGGSSWCSGLLKPIGREHASGLIRKYLQLCALCCCCMGPGPVLPSPVPVVPILIRTAPQRSQESGCNTNWNFFPLIAQSWWGHPCTKEIRILYLFSLASEYKQEAGRYSEIHSLLFCWQSSQPASSRQVLWNLPAAMPRPKPFQACITVTAHSQQLSTIHKTSAYAHIHLCISILM